MFLTLLFLLISPVKALEIIPQISVFSPNRLVLEPISGQSEFHSTITGIPFFSLGLSQQLATHQNLIFFAREKVSYLYKQFLTNSLDIVHLNGANFEGFLETRYRTGFAVDPGFSFGVGTLVLYESSSSKEIVIGIPQITFGPMFTFLSYDKVNTDSFLGMSFSLQYTQSLFTSYAYNGLSINVGVHFSL